MYVTWSTLVTHRLTTPHDCPTLIRPKPHILLSPTHTTDLLWSSHGSVNSELSRFSLIAVIVIQVKARIKEPAYLEVHGRLEDGSACRTSAALAVNNLMRAEPSVTGREGAFCVLAMIDKVLGAHILGALANLLAWLAAWLAECGLGEAVRQVVCAIVEHKAATFDRHPLLYILLLRRGLGEFSFLVQQTFFSAMRRNRRISFLQAFFSCKATKPSIFAQFFFLQAVRGRGASHPASQP